ncbi:pentatricopeptide repeat-containing protein 1, mitochondrial-like [Lineus longissimus]|uniref:pentatricopeptide repeat-containing protein 1, mitochondrial-like n=1 Tax=Lineus longissimus TaxID=88925 RepID=UPI002B4DAD7B
MLKMLRLSNHANKFMPGGSFSRIDSFLCKRWKDLGYRSWGILTSSGPLYKPPIQQCACLATDSQDKKPFPFTRRARERIKYQKSNKTLFGREKIQRNFSELEVENDTSLSECLKSLDENDRFGMLPSVEEGSGDVKRKSVKSNRSSTGLERSAKSNKLKSGGGAKSQTRNSRSSSKSVNLEAADATAKILGVDGMADKFGNFDANSLHSRKTTEWKSIDSKTETFGNEFSNSSIHLNIGASDDVPQLSNSSPVSQESTDAFGTIAEDFEKTFLRPGPITKANAGLRSEEGAVADDDFHLRLSKDNRRHEQNWYERRLEKLSKDGQVIEALDFLEKTMIEKDRVMPTAFAYTVVIDALAKYGYPEGAFRLFRKMLAYKLTPHDHTYTALFNACANCPDKATGRKYADRFRETLAKKDILPNRTTYKAMMKAFAMFGDLQATFALADELYEKRGRIDHDSFSHMLMGAISDGAAGFKHAVEVFRSIRKHGLTPSITHYNLLLRAMRDCGVGSQEFLYQLLGGGASTSISSGDKMDQEQISLERNLQKRIGVSSGEKSTINENVPETESTINKDVSIMNKDVSTMNKEVSLNVTTRQKGSSEMTEKNIKSFLEVSSNCLSKIPDIMSPNPDTSQMISVSDIKTSADRLELVGGVPGLLAHMQRDGVTPDIKTLTILLDVMPSDTRVEEMLVATLGDLKVVPDTGFFNILMRKRVFRQDYLTARSVLDHLVTFNLAPDIKTFAIFALTCRKKKEAFVLLNDMQNIGIEPTPEVMGHFSRASNMDFDYMLAIIIYMSKHGIKPNEQFLRLTEKRIKQAKRFIVEKERGGDVPYYARSDRFDTEFGDFLKNYRTWLMVMDVQRPDPYWKMFKDRDEAVEEKKRRAEDMKKSVYFRADATASEL